MPCASYHIISYHGTYHNYIFIFICCCFLSRFSPKNTFWQDFDVTTQTDATRREATQSSEEQLRFLSHSCAMLSTFAAHGNKFGGGREEEKEERKRRNILRQHSTGMGYILYLQCTHDVLQNTPQVILLWKCVYTVGNGWEVRERTPRGRLEIEPQAG